MTEEWEVYCVERNKSFYCMDTRYINCSKDFAYNRQNWHKLPLAEECCRAFCRVGFNSRHGPTSVPECAVWLIPAHLSQVPHDLFQLDREHVDLGSRKSVAVAQATFVTPLANLCHFKILISLYSVCLWNFVSDHFVLFYSIFL